jgi:hypothetical protein
MLNKNIFLIQKQNIYYKVILKFLYFITINCKNFIFINFIFTFFLNFLNNKINFLILKNNSNLNI